MVLLFGLANLPAATQFSVLDTNFGTGGIVTTSVSPGYDIAYGVAVQPDGRIVVAGNGTNQYAVARYTATGVLDTTFNGTGIKTFSIYGSEGATAVAIQDDGKIVVAGSSGDLGGTRQGASLARLNSDGTLDLTFNGTGTVLAFDSSKVSIHAMAIQPDGKIVLAGEIYGPGIDGVILRFTASGILDPSFGGTGRVTCALGPGTDILRSVAIQADGKIVAAGSAADGGGYHPWLTRLNPDGTADLTFNGGGNVVLAGTPGDCRGAVAIQPDGKIVGAWATGPSGSRDVLLARFNSDSSADSTFHSTGSVVTPVSEDDEPRALAVDLHGNIAVAGTCTSGGWERFFAMRYTPAGVLDASFGGIGYNTIGKVRRLPANGMALQNDGSLFVTGYWDDGATYYQFALARFRGYNASATAPDLSITATTGDSKTIALPFPAKDADGDPVTLTKVTPGAHLAVDGWSGGSVTFTPAANFAGETSLLYTVSDSFGGAATGTVSITVADNDAPALHLPEDIVVEAQDASGSGVAFDLDASDAVDGALVPTVDHTSGSVFPIGTTLVSAAASDAAGNTVNGSFKVTVRDTTAPALFGTFAPLSLHLRASGTAAVPDYTAQAIATDAVGVVSLTQVPAAGTAQAAGLMHVTITAADAAGNSRSTPFDVAVGDTTAPTINAPPNGFAPLAMAAEANGAIGLPNYASQAIASDDVALAGVTQSPPAGAPISVGTVEVTLVAHDAAGNSAELKLHPIIRPAAAVHRLLLEQGTPAPGAGKPGGPPADALLAGFGSPALDNHGNVAVLAKWTSALGPATGLFVNGKLLTHTGGSVPGVPGATIASLTDPVIDQGRVVFLATLQGVSAGTSAVVMSDALSGSLEIVARGGGFPVGGEGARFKRFKAAALSGQAIAIQAELMRGASRAPMNGANDTCLCLLDPGHPLRVMLREGQLLGGRRLKTFISFAAGAGSPGSGRGWVHGAEGVSRISALSLFGDRSQAIIEADVDGGFSTLAEASHAGAAFTGIGIPAVAQGGVAAFRGRLAGDPKTGRGQGIFATSDPQRMEPLARIDGVAPGTDSTFARLGDPVLADDLGIAFTAALAGHGAARATSETLWWRPPGGELRLLAQSGAPATETPSNFRWTAFVSLAIAANRGPVFVGAMAARPAPASAAAEMGLWATDFADALRLIFKTGDEIAGKRVKSFTVLTAVPGSLGVGRSLNDDGLIVWRAKFDGGGTAIVLSEVP